MPFQPIPNTVSAAVRYLQGGVAVENVWYFQKPTGYNQADLDDLALAIDDWTNDSWKGLVAVDTVFKEVYVRGQENSADLQTTSAVNAGWLGAGGSGWNNNTSKAIRLDSGLTGRNARGRFFVAGLPVPGSDGLNRVKQTWVDDVIEALEALKTIVEALGFIWVIVSKFVDGVKRTTAVTFDLQGFSVSNLTTDSMRGRLPKS